MAVTVHHHQLDASLKMAAAAVQQPALGPAELHLHQEITQLTQAVREGAARLSKYDGTVPRSTAKQAEDQVQQYLRKLKSRLNDLTHAANEQDT